MPDPAPPPERLLLLFGLPLAALAFFYWTGSDRLTYGLWTLRGFEKGLFILTAVLLLYVVIRLARIVLDRDPS